MATIIRRDQVDQHFTGEAARRVAFDFEDFAGHAEEYVDKVRREAAKIVQEANAEAEAIRRRAEQAGREAAQAEIERILDEKVATQMKTLRPALEGVVHQLTDARGAWLDHWDRSAMQLAARMAARVVRGELRDRPEITLTWIREALQMAAGAADITVRVNPQDHANLGSQIEHLAQTLSPIAPARIVADDSITLGGCRVDTQHGSIDQQIEAQLQQLVEEVI